MNRQIIILSFILLAVTTLALPSSASAELKYSFQLKELEQIDSEGQKNGENCQVYNIQLEAVLHPAFVAEKIKNLPLARLGPFKVCNNQQFWSEDPNLKDRPLPFRYKSSFSKKQIDNRISALREEGYCPKTDFEFQISITRDNDSLLEKLLRNKEIYSSPWLVLPLSAADKRLPYKWQIPISTGEIDLTLEINVEKIAEE